MFRTGSLLALTGALHWVSCSEPTRPEPQNYQIQDSFENGLSAWTINSLDDKVDTVTIDWHVVSSGERASQGSFSARLFMDNLTDAAKIWLGRTVDVARNKTYSVTIVFDLASSDFSEVNSFSVLANVLPRRPTTRDDVVMGVQEGYFPEGTYNGGIENYVWLRKSLTRSVKSTDDGRLYIILGIWGTWEGPRTYYFDNFRLLVHEE